MGTAEIRRVAIKDVLDDPAFPELLAMFERAVAVEGLPTSKWRRDIYELLEDSGRILSLAAYMDGELIGFLGLMVSMLPQYGEEVAVIDTVFVRPEHRGTGAGLQLVHEAEAWARETGAVAVMLSTPVDGVLGRIVQRWGYQQTRHTYMKLLGKAEDRTAGSDARSVEESRGGQGPCVPAER